MSNIPLAESSTRTRGAVRGILLSTVYAGVVAVAANTIILRVGLAAGAAQSTPAGQTITGFSPIAYITLSVLGVLAGAIGWQVIARRAKRPAAVLGVLVPVVLLLSLTPLVAEGVMSADGGVWTAMITLGLVHLVTVVIGVLVYVRVLTLRR